MKNHYSELSRRRLLAGLSLALPALWLGGCRSAPAGAQDNRPFEPLDLSDRQWREILAPEQYTYCAAMAPNRPSPARWTDKERVKPGQRAIAATITVKDGDEATTTPLPQEKGSGVTRIVQRLRQKRRCATALSSDQNAFARQASEA